MGPAMGQTKTRPHKENEFVKSDVSPPTYVLAIMVCARSKMRNGLYICNRKAEADNNTYPVI